MNLEWNKNVWVNLSIKHLGLQENSRDNTSFRHPNFAKLEYGTEKDEFTKFSLEANK